MKNIETLRTEQGFTLIELIVSMVILSVALAGILSVINYTTSHSSDPVLTQQAIAIAEAYMEEITLKSYNDPDGIDSEASRALFDDVDDYNNLPDTVVRGPTGNAIAGLAAYSVSVLVDAPQGYGPSGATVPGKRIAVTVTTPAGESLTLAGNRANF